MTRWSEIKAGIEAALLRGFVDKDDAQPEDCDILSAADERYGLDNKADLTRRARLWSLIMRIEDRLDALEAIERA